MTVKEAIKILRTMPPNLQIFTADHDHGKFEVNSQVHCIDLIDKDTMTEYENDNDKTVHGYERGTFKDLPKKYVVIRP